MQVKPRATTGNHFVFNGRGLRRRKTRGNLSTFTGTKAVFPHCPAAPAVAASVALAVLRYSVLRYRRAAVLLYCCAAPQRSFVAPLGAAATSLSTDDSWQAGNAATFGSLPPGRELASDAMSPPIRMDLAVSDACNPPTPTWLPLLISCSPRPGLPVRENCRSKC